MELKLHRHFLGKEYTIGKLYINNEYFCDTLEDTYRDLTKTNKIYGETAIPYGKYDIAMDIISPKYSAREPYKTLCKGCVPRLLNVPHFDGILIHIGNYPKDTYGCILVGKNTVKGAVMQSTDTFKALYAKMVESHNKGEKITINIV